jgi:hypothetical protein
MTRRPRSGNATVVANAVPVTLAPSGFLKVTVPDPFELGAQVKPGVPPGRGAERQAGRGEPGAGEVSRHRIESGQWRLIRSVASRQPERRRGIEPDGTAQPGRLGVRGNGQHDQFRGQDDHLGCAATLITLIILTGT